MLTLNRLPAEVIAYVLKSFSGKTHGHYMQRLPPLNINVAGNKYDCFPNPSENAITIIVAYADGERNLQYDRLRNAKEEQSKAHVKLAGHNKALQEATSQAARGGPRQARAEGAKKQFEEQVSIAEREVKRLADIIETGNAQLDNWQAQESISVFYSEVESNLFTLTEADAVSVETQTPLEAVKAAIQEGDEHVISEIAMLMPPTELSLDQVERFLLEQDPLHRTRISFIIQKIAEGRKNNANPRGQVPELRENSVVDRGGDDQAGTGAGEVPALSGAAAKTDQPSQLPANPGKSTRRKRS